MLEAEGKSEVEIGFCVLSEGDYEIGAAVEEVRSMKLDPHENKDGSGEAEDLLLKGWKDGKGERRVWYADEPCVLLARDAYAAED